MKELKQNSGKGCSEHYPKGLRRKDSNGNQLAPRHLRELGKHFLSECTEKQQEEWTNG